MTSDNDGRMQQFSTSSAASMVKLLGELEIRGGDNVAIVGKWNEKESKCKDQDGTYEN